MVEVAENYKFGINTSYSERLFCCLLKKLYDEQMSLDLTSEDGSNCSLTLIIKGNGTLSFADIHQV
jgi:hypothetical protein